MKEKIIKHKKIILATIVTLIFFIGLFKVEYSRCTFRMYVNDYSVEFNHFLTLGRYIVAIWWKIVSVLKFNLNQTYFVSYAMAIIFMILSLYKTQNIVEKLIKKNWRKDVVALIISILITLNPFVIELFLYLEKGCMVMSLFFAIFAAEKMLNYFENRKIIEIIKTTLCILISAFCYQGATLMYLAFAFVFAIKYSKNIKQFILNNVIISIPFLLGYGINFICVKLFFTSVRIAEHINLIENGKVILKKLPQLLIDNFGTLPKFSIIIGLISLFAITCIYSYKNKQIKHILAVVYIYLATLIITLVPQLVLETSSVQILARSSIPYGGIIGTILLYMVSEISFDKITKNIIYGVTTLIILIEFIYMQITIIDHYKINELDLNTANRIKECIEQYEKETQNTVDKVVLYSDKEVKRYYPKLKHYGQINEKVIAIDGRILDILNYISNNKRYWQISEKNVEYEKFFAQNDWDYFDKEQLKFENDILHLCIF